MELNKIKGENLVLVYRAADMPELDFGDAITLNKYGKQREYPEYSLHVQCPLRIVIKNQIILGRDDIYCVLDSEDDNDWDSYGNNRYDKIVNDIIEPMLPVKVLDVFVSELGDILIKLENEIEINIFIGSKGNEDKEFWRFIDFKQDVHIVFEGRELNRYD